MNRNGNPGRPPLDPRLLASCFTRPPPLSHNVSVPPPGVPPPGVPPPGVPPPGVPPPRVPLSCVTLPRMPPPVNLDHLTRPPPPMAKINSKYMNEGPNLAVPPPSRAPSYPPPDSPVFVPSYAPPPVIPVDATVPPLFYKPPKVSDTPITPYTQTAAYYNYESPVPKAELHYSNEYSSYNLPGPSYTTNDAENGLSAVKAKEYAIGYGRQGSLQREYISKVTIQGNEQMDSAHKRLRERDRIKERDINRGRDKSRESDRYGRRKDNSVYRHGREMSREHCRERSSDRYRMSSDRSRDRRSSREHHSDRRSVERRGRESEVRGPYSVAHSERVREPTRHSSTTSRRRSPTPHRKMTDKEKILETYRKNYCHNHDEVMRRIKHMTDEDKEESPAWVRSSPAEHHYRRDEHDDATQSSRLQQLCASFNERLICQRRAARPLVDELPALDPQTPHVCDHSDAESSSSDEDSLLFDDECLRVEAHRVVLELKRKQCHPRRLHPELWYNTSGEKNGGPLCRCNSRTRRVGMRHGVFADEPRYPRCQLHSSNLHKLFHYRLAIAPATNFLIRTPTIITHDDHEFLFCGFSMFSHYKLEEIPPCKVIRFNIEYTISYAEEKAPQNFTIRELELFEEYLYVELLELVDLDLGKPTDQYCSQFHFMPRFVRSLPDGGTEVLSMSVVLEYLLEQYRPLIPPARLREVHRMNHYEWQCFIDQFKGMIVTQPGKKPCSVRVDQIDRSPPTDRDEDPDSTAKMFDKLNAEFEAARKAFLAKSMAINPFEDMETEEDKKTFQVEVGNVKTPAQCDSHSKDSQNSTNKADFPHNLLETPQESLSGVPRDTVGGGGVEMSESVEQEVDMNAPTDENAKLQVALANQNIDKSSDQTETPLETRQLLPKPGESRIKDDYERESRAHREIKVSDRYTKDDRSPRRDSRTRRARDRERSRSAIRESKRRSRSGSSRRHGEARGRRDRHSRRSRSHSRDRDRGYLGGKDRRYKERKNKSPERDPHDYYPEIVHFGIRPPQLSYAGNQEYQQLWRFYVKLRHLVANQAKPTIKKKEELKSIEERLQQMRTQSKMKRGVTIAVSSRGFYATGLMCDVVQHAMLMPVLARHLRFHKSLEGLERTIGYRFKSRELLQKALTHPSFRENYGTNPDHAKNSLTNCGIRQPEYGDRNIHYTNTRKKGINILINIMSRFAESDKKESAINHNERLEFLGDAVIELITSVHLFNLFPALAEGGLATYRAALVQNQHLALLAKKINLDHYMLFAHGSDLCRDVVMRHAMANCFEALMAAVFLDGDLPAADEVFSLVLARGKPAFYHEVWTRPRLHPLQAEEPDGDRHYIPRHPILQRLTEFENLTGLRFKHIRLLARAFTDRSVGVTHLTLGSNQRLEFLGDTVLQMLVSYRLYTHFPEHHEGHLSLLRSCLVNNRTQALICDELGLTHYAIYSNPNERPSTKKHKADLFEALLGAVYVDRGLTHCQVICGAVVYPKLQEFITNQGWNDPKSKLQQYCLMLRTMKGGEPDIPIYKVVESLGPANTRVYTVAVYFRGERLAAAKGHSIQEAEMNAASEALAHAHQLFPQLNHQKRTMAKSKKSRRSAAKKDLLPESKKPSDGNHPLSADVDKNVPRAYRAGVNWDSSSDSSHDEAEPPTPSDAAHTNTDEIRNVPCIFGNPLYAKPPLPPYMTDTTLTTKHLDKTDRSDDETGGSSGQNNGVALASATNTKSANTLSTTTAPSIETGTTTDATHSTNNAPTTKLLDDIDSSDDGSDGEYDYNDCVVTLTTRDDTEEWVPNPGSKWGIEEVHTDDEDLIHLKDTSFHYNRKNVITETPKRKLPNTSSDKSKTSKDTTVVNQSEHQAVTENVLEITMGETNISSDDSDEETQVREREDLKEVDLEAHNSVQCCVDTDSDDADDSDDGVWIDCDRAASRRGDNDPS